MLRTGFIFGEEWKVTENYGMDDILPHVGGAAFVFSLSISSSVHDKSCMHDSTPEELKFLNMWVSDMKATLEKNPQILNSNASKNNIHLLFETEAQCRYTGFIDSLQHVPHAAAPLVVWFFDGVSTSVQIEAVKR